MAPYIYIALAFRGDGDGSGMACRKWLGNGTGVILKCVFFQDMLARAACECVGPAFPQCLLKYSQAKTGA